MNVPLLNHYVRLRGSCYRLTKAVESWLAYGPSHHGMLKHAARTDANFDARKLAMLDVSHNKMLSWPNIDHMEHGTETGQDTKLHVAPSGLLLHPHRSRCFKLGAD